MTAPEPHPSIAHLTGLLGTWRGKGTGVYPTIETFDYFEEVTFGHVGKPFIAYTQKTRHAETDLPLHAESGYLRPVGESGVEFVVAQPTGIMELHEGTVRPAEDGLSVELSSTSIPRTATAVLVEHVDRVVTVEADTMTYRLDMAAVGLELQHHLSATLQRQ